jgi:hypothetical protein
MLPGRVLDKVVADAANAAYEQHAGRHVRGDELGIMTGPARHAHPLPESHSRTRKRRPFY